MTMEGNLETGKRRLSSTSNEEQDKKRVKVQESNLVRHHIIRPPEVPPEGAYAKLVGRNLTTGESFCAYITVLPTFLGRTPTKQTQIEPNFIPLGSFPRISRKHAMIDFDYVSGYYTISPLTKNTVTVRRVHHRCEANSSPDSYRINSRDPIRIGDVGFYFLKSL